MLSYAKLCQTVPNCAELRKMFELSLRWHALTQLGRYWLSLTHQHICAQLCMFWHTNFFHPGT